MLPKRGVGRGDGNSGVEKEPVLLTWFSKWLLEGEKTSGMRRWTPTGEEDDEAEEAAAAVAAVDDEEDAATARADSLVAGTRGDIDCARNASMDNSEES